MLYNERWHDTLHYVGYVESALLDLKRARDKLKAAKAYKAARYVSRALKSAEGAARHVKHWRDAAFDRERRNVR